MPSLEVGFAIDTGGSFESLQQLQAVMDTTEAKVVAEAAKIEKATSGMVNLSGSTAEVKAFGNAYTREMESLSRSNRIAESAAERMIKQLDWQAMTFGKTAQEIREMRVEQRALAAESRGLTDVANRLRAANAEIQRLEGTSNTINTTSGKTAFGLRNLGFQVQDLGVQFAMAAQSGDPLRGVMMALVQQGPQIKDAMEQAELSVGGLVQRLGAGAARFGVFAVGAAAGAYQMKQFTDSLNDSAGTDAFIRSLGLTADEIKELENTTVTFGDVALGTWDVVSGGIWDVIGPAVTAARGWFDEWFTHMNAEGAKLINNVVGFFVGGFNAIGATWSRLPGAIGDIATNAANATIAAINKMVQMAVNGINALINAANTLPGVDIATLTAPQIGMIENTFAGAGKGAADAFTTAFDAAQTNYWGAFTSAVGNAAEKRFQDRMRAQAGELIGDRPDSPGSAGRKSREIDELARAYDRALKAAQGFNASLEKEIAQFGKAAIEIKRMEAETAALAAEKAIVAGLSKEQAGALQKEAAAIRTNVTEWERLTRAQAEADWRQNVIVPLEQELALLGKVGPERELAALAFEEQAMKAQWAKDGISDVNAAWKEYYAIRKGNIDKAEELRRTAEEAELLNDQLRDMIGLLGNLGKVGDAIGGLLGIFTGNTSAVGGVLGQILNIKTGGFFDEEIDGKKTGDRIANTIGTELSRVFGKTGPFAQTMTNLLQGAGTGMLAGSLLGKQSTTQKLGSALGGALGQVAGEALGKAIGGLAGKLGGPLGAIAGGILGSALGGLLSPNRSAGANLTGAGAFTVGGKDSKNYGIASDLAGSVMAGLGDIAKALGGTFSGGFNTTIGVRGDEFRVNTNGTSLKKQNGAIGFGEDSAAAIAFAIQDAIKDGALMGLRAGTQALLQKEGEFEAQLQKALAFEGVFRELKAMTSPLVVGLEDIADRFAQLKEIFTEAGASAEEFGQLQELMTRQQQALIDQISANYRSTFYTDAENLKFAKQTIKDVLTPLGKGSVDTVAEYKKLVEATDALTNPELYGALMELADEFGVIKDAADAAAANKEALKALAEALKAQRTQLQVDLLNAQGRALEATAMQRAAELAAMDSSLRTLQQQVWAHQDLVEAWERQSGELNATIKTFGDLAATLREFRDGLYQTDDATSSYTRRLAELQRVGGLASLGDKDALGLLPGVGQDFLEVAKRQASSLQDYQRDVARVARYADTAIGAADGMVSEAQAQLEALEDQVSQFIQLNETALSIEDALERMVIAQTAPAQTNADLAPRLDRNNELLERLHTAIEAGALASIDTATLIRRVSRNGVALATTAS
ncbi:hypothetical protein [Croceicoccus sp. BE223]|uniref:hypothetical protein n=1 Tax=Croceicoccus sp. BE223 TaxID=2817716 RepID=UPI0028667BC8|nr:hypothetical protein [Croceicoccus sp. BE223]MDR7102996.1 hypothetical protein [Croceicoccus sp. BE223]